MKRCLIILIALSGLLNRVCAQSPSAAIDSLVKCNVITAKQRTILERELKRKEYSTYPSQLAVLGGLDFILLQKTFHLDPHKNGLMYSYRIENVPHKTRDSLNTSMHSLLEKIKNAGLLTDRVYAYALKGIDSGRYVADVQLIGSLTEISFRFETLAPKKLLPVAEQLHQNGIVSDSSFLRLQHDIVNDKIESEFQLNDYCKFERTFDLTTYPENPHLWLEQLHRDMATILPGLHFTDFSYTTVPDSSQSMGSIPDIKLKVSFTCNGLIYKHSSVIMNYPNRQGDIRAKDIGFIHDFYRVFNKVLADQQSPYRLHIALNHASGRDDFYRFSLIALREEQVEVFMKDPCMHYMSMSMESFDNTLTSAKVDSSIDAWRKLGLFAHLSEAQIKKGTDDAETADLFSINHLLIHFPQVIYSLDSAMMNPYYPDINLLKHLAKITHDAFNPTKITQRKVKGGVKLQYFAAGKMHSFIFKTANGWLDDRFTIFLKSLGEENNLPGAFYTLPYEGSIIYLTKEQHTYSIEHQLLNFEIPQRKDLLKVKTQ